jgi:hypothetical protein
MRRGPKGSESASFDAGSGSATLVCTASGAENHVPPHAQAELALGRRATRAPTLSVLELVADGVCLHACCRSEQSDGLLMEQPSVGVRAAEGVPTRSQQAPAETARRASGLLSVATVKER